MLIPRLVGLSLMAISAVACRSGAAYVQPPLSAVAVAGDWSSYGGDPGGSRYSALAQINRENVGTLEIAWTYRTGETEAAFATAAETSFEATPLVLDGLMYLATPLGRVIALDPATGEERWAYDPEVDRTVGYGDFANRGVSTWLDPAAVPGEQCRRRIFVATIDARLIALDAINGRPCEGFGNSGSIDLRSGLRNPPESASEYQQTSPPAVVNNVVVAGSSVADNNRPDAASGEVRGFDARTGKLLWAWDPVPQDPIDPGYGSWIGPQAHRTGGANAWTVLTADPQRDLVFVPTGSPSPDYFGGLRLGDNRYGNSVVALRASTGERVWHFQTVHHDLWDYDNAAPAAAVSIRSNGKSVPAVLQATKSGMLFVLNLETGEPIFPIEERAVPSSTIPGEQTSPTQPFTLAIQPLSPHHYTLDDAWGPTEEDRLACRAMMEPLRNEGIFTPPSLEGTLVVPSNVGGSHWGGIAVDTVRHIAVFPVNRVAAMVQLIPEVSLDPARMLEGVERYGEEYTHMRGTPYVMRRRILLGPSGLPCTPPPFGALVGISLESGQKIWEVPHGSMEALAPDAVPEWGSINLGGPVVTAGGVAFVAGTLDRRLHGYDVETGRELWSGELPASARATPMSYQVGSTQYVAVAVGGGDIFGRGDSLIVFALPRQ